MNPSPPPIAHDPPRSATGGKGLAARVAGAILMLGAFFMGGWELGAPAKPNLVAARKQVADVAVAPKIAPGSTAASPHNVPWDLESPLAKVLGPSTGPERLAGVVALIEQTPVTKLAGLLDLTRSCPEVPVRLTIYDLVLARWTGADPLGALAYASAFAARGGTPAFLNSVFAMWAGHDPKAALAGAIGVKSIALRIAAMDAVLASWAEGRDPLGAVAAAKRLPPGEGKTDFVHLVFLHWGRIDPAAAMGAISQIENAETRRLVQNEIIGNLANINPAGAFQLLRGLPVSPQAIATYAELFSKWAAQNPPAAFAALGEIAAVAARNTATQSVIRSWLALDPVAAFDAAQTLPAGAARDGAVADCVLVLAWEDPAAAAEYVARLSPGANRNRLVEALAVAWADSDPFSALTWLEHTADESGYTQAVKQFLANLNDLHAVEALNYFMSLPDDRQRNRNLLTVLAVMAKSDGPGALDWAKVNLTGAAYDNAVKVVLGQLVEANPPLASTIVNQLPAGADRDELIKRIAEPLARLDFAGAIAWAQNLPADVTNASREEALSTIVKTMAERDPAAAAREVIGLAADPAAASAMATVADTWAKADSNAALAWAETLPSGAARDGAMAAAVAAYSHLDAAGAWEVASRELPAGVPATTAAQSEIAIFLARKDPAAASQDLMTIPDGNSRAFAVPIIAAGWVKDDVAAASQWVATLPISDERDHALQQVLPPLAQTQPEAALALALTASSDDSRYNELYLTLTAWGAIDREGALAALETAPVPDNRRRGLQVAIQSAGQMMAGRDRANKAFQEMQAKMETQNAPQF